MCVLVTIRESRWPLGLTVVSKPQPTKSNFMKPLKINNKLHHGTRVTTDIIQICCPFMFS